MVSATGLRIRRFAATVIGGAIFMLILLPSRTHAGDTARTITIVAFGDSLTAGYLLKPSDAFPVQLEAALRAKGHNVNVVNAGVSGDTTAAGLERLQWTLETGGDAVIVELGANDALRGTDPKDTRENLDKIISKIKAKGADVLLTGIPAPANWGDAYKASFDRIFPDLSEKYAIPLYPFFLAGVKAGPKHVLPDGLHPTALGVAEIVKGILPEAEALVARVKARLSSAKN